jgi:hypothetical protein
MLRRVRAPARLADAEGAKITEGPPPSSPERNGERPLQIGSYKPGDWSKGRTPGLTIAAIPVRIRAPQEPE